MDGFALMFWVAVGGLVLLVAAGGVEWLLSRPDRRWLKRLHDQERARTAWQSRVMIDQCFFKQEDK